MDLFRILFSTISMDGQTYVTYDPKVCMDTREVNSGKQSNDQLLQKLQEIIHFQNGRKIQICKFRNLTYYRMSVKQQTFLYHDQH